MLYQKQSDPPTKMYFSFQIIAFFRIVHIILCSSISFDQCGPSDTIFVSAKHEIQIERIYGENGWNETSLVADDVVCRSLCHFETRCQSAIFNIQDHSCLLQDINRFSPNIRIRQELGNLLYDKRTCRVAQEGGFIDLVPDALDCKDIQDKGWRSNGVYGIPVTGEDDSYQTISCKMSLLGGGWTVIQGRIDGSVSFENNWSQYKQGFGDLVGDFWYGNERIHKLTWWSNNDILFELHLPDGSKFYPMYDEFKVDNENNNYTLTVGNRVETNYGDSVDYTRHSNFEVHNQKRFYTKDRRKDFCSTYLGGWWFDTCYKVYLNGRYGEHSDRGICWDTFTHSDDGTVLTSFEYTRMMIRKK